MTTGQGTLASDRHQLTEDTLISTPAISIKDVSYNYGNRQALNNVSFDVWPGHFTALLGANGAGKTTLFSLITRLFDTNQGAIRLCGKSARLEGARALSPLGVVFQQTTLDLDLTVRQNLKYFASLRGLSRHETHERIKSCLEALDMYERVDERVRDLNGGHRRRVEIARAMLHKPALMILDEPTVGLDLHTRAAIVNHIHDLAKNENTAILWTTHLIDEIRNHDHLVVLDKGEVIEKGTVTEVLKRAGKESVSEAFEALVNPQEGRLT